MNWTTAHVACHFYRASACKAI